MALAFLKKHWLGGLHILAAIVLFEDASVRAYITNHPESTGTLGVVWAELMRWLQSPRNQ